MKNLLSFLRNPFHESHPEEYWWSLGGPRGIAEVPSGSARSPGCPEGFFSSIYNMSIESRGFGGPLGPGGPGGSVTVSRFFTMAMTRTFQIKFDR